MAVGCAREPAATFSMDMHIYVHNLYATEPLRGQKRQLQAHTPFQPVAFQHCFGSTY